MKEKGILFNSDMIQAIREGRKRVTRRVIVPQPPGDAIAKRSPVPGVWAFYAGGKAYMHAARIMMGDLLWVREKLVRVHHEADSPYWYAAYASDGLLVWVDGEPLRWRWQRDWLSPIHMPKEAARLWLVVESVRPERVRDITEDDAFAEGVGGGDWLGDPVGEFAKLWDRINAKRGYPWDANPWVWRIQFEQRHR